MPVQEAVEAGLVDEIIGGAQLLSAQVVNCVGGGLRALSGVGGLPSPAQLRARKAELEAQDGAHSAPAALGLEQEGERARLAVSLSVKKYY